MPPKLPVFLWLTIVTAMLLPSPGAALVLHPSDEVTIRFSGDFIGGYFNDDAMKSSAGRETQYFKMSRGLLGFEARHEGGFGGLFEYNFLADEPKRVDGNTAYNDFYKNLGTELLYYGDFKARNAYAFYERPGRLIDWRLRAGRMVNIIGFEEEEVPFWGRNDSPHAHFLTKEILNGVAIRTGTGWFSLEGAVLSGRGRPDSGYNWYLNGQTDPNTKGNNTPVVEAEAILRWHEYLQLSAGYHRNKTGSAAGGLFSGKHNDNRMIFGARLQSGRLGPALNRALMLGQVSRFEVGLTENGVQGNHTNGISKDLKKNGWFVTGGLLFYDRLWLYATYEELDRIDALVWKEIADFNPNHPAFDSIERSTILQIDLILNPWAKLIAFYRFMEFDFPHLSAIPIRNREASVDKMGLVLRVGF
jgi:hypothetical protein